MELIQEIERLVSKEYEDIKKNSETFGEVEKAYTSYYRDLIWEGKGNLGTYVFEEMKKKFMEDLRNVKIEHPSNKVIPDEKQIVPDLTRGITINLP